MFLVDPSNTFGVSEDTLLSTPFLQRVPEIGAGQRAYPVGRVVGAKSAKCVGATKSSCTFE
jgi:hypothetical protein